MKIFTPRWVNKDYKELLVSARRIQTPRVIGEEGRRGGEEGQTEGEGL